MFNNEKLEKILGQTPMRDEQECTNAFEEQMEFDKLKTKVLKYVLKNGEWKKGKYIIVHCCKTKYKIDNIDKCKNFFYGK